LEAPRPVDFYKLYYAPNNAYIVVVGDFSSEEILAKIKAALWKNSPRRRTPEVACRRAEQRGNAGSLQKEAELPFHLLFTHRPI